MVDRHLQNEANGWVGSGGNPWHLDKDTESYEFLTNMGDKPVRIGFKVWADGQIFYLGSLELVPHETRMIDLRKLRDAQETDLEKHQIPAGATDGSVLWLRLDNVPVMGRLAVITRHGGMASSYDCCLCGCPGQYGYTLLIPVITCPITVAVGDQVHSQVWYSPPCGGTYYYFDMTSSLGWSSTNTNVFTLNNSNPKGLLTGIGGGSATALAQGTTACQAWYMMGAVCQCSSWVPIVGNTPCSVLSIVYTSNQATNIAGTTQSAIVGQQIALTALYSLPSGVTVSSQSWSVGGTIVGGYTPTPTSYSSGATTAATLNQQSTTFYWASPGSSIKVTFTLNLSNGQSPKATVTFNVAGVSSPSMGVKNYGSLTIDNLTGCSQQPAGPYLVYGNLSGPVPGCAGQYTGTPGISFTPSGTQPSGGGSFSFVQLINSDSRQYTTSSGTVSCSSSSGLDTGYPYPLNNVGNATDAPFIPLPSTYTAASRTFNATMWLMWTPSALPSGCNGAACTIPVPLAYTTWNFSGSTTQSNGTWGTPSGSGSAGSLTPANGTYPKWSNVSTETCN